MPTNGRLSYTRAKVEMHERMDGSIAVYYQGQCLVTKPAPPGAPVLRARSTKRLMLNKDEPGEVKVAALTKKPLQPKALWMPGPYYPWRRPFKVHIDRG